MALKVLNVELLSDVHMQSTLLLLALSSLYLVEKFLVTKKKKKFPLRSNDPHTTHNHMSATKQNNNYARQVTVNFIKEDDKYRGRNLIF